MAVPGRPNVWDVWDQLIGDGVPENMTDEESDEGNDINESDIEVPLVSEAEGSDNEHEMNDGFDAIGTENIVWSADNQYVNVRPFTAFTGPQVLLNADASELACFNTFFSPNMIHKLVQETNNNAARKQLLSGNDPNWIDTDFAEMSAFLGILILMGIVHVPDYKFLWSTNKFLANGGIKEVMPVRRYEKLTQYLHVNEPEAGTPDKLARIRPLLDSILEKCKVAMKPKKNQSIDEAMIPYKGRFAAKQYIPSKPVKWGIKASYCHDFDVYLGKGSTPDNGKGLGYNVVNKLTEELRGKYHHVYFDSYFTSIPLAIDLLENGIYMCGTVRKNRRLFPEELKNLPVRLEQGQYVGRQSGNLVAVVWMDNRHVSVLSTNQSLEQFDITERRQKDGTVRQITRPRIITNYQENFRGGDISDQLRSKYPVGRSSKKWWKFLFNFLINLCIINGFVFYDHFNQVERRKKRYTQLDFRVNLVSQLVNGFSFVKRRTPPLVVFPMNMSNPNLHRFIRLKKKKSTCKYCPKHGAKKRKETIHGCSKCDKHLCSLECHRRFHALIGITVMEE